MPLECRIINEIKEIDRASWNACFINEPEDYDYLAAVEHAGIPGFTYCYATLWSDTLLVAAMPAFFMNYALDTTLQGGKKKLAGIVRSFFPNALNLHLACLGSPCTEVLSLGFHGSVADADKARMVKQMVSAFEKLAHSRGCKLTGMKDVPQNDTALWQPALEGRGYKSVSGMPTAYMDIDFTTMDEYLARLSRSTRKNMRRKMKMAESLRLETRSDISDVLPEIMALYRDTRNRSDWQFEELTQDYFSNVLAQMQGRAECILYYIGDQLLAANLLVHDGNILVDKFFCMRGEEGRAYNLYFLSWMANIQHCLTKGYKRYQSGQANCAIKVSLGSSLSQNFMSFRHDNAFTHAVLKLVAPMIAINEPELLKAAA